MSIAVWLVLGVVAGLITARMYRHIASAMALDVLLGVVGAMGGGLALSALRSGNITTFNILGCFAAAAGAIATLVGYRSIFRPA